MTATEIVPVDFSRVYASAGVVHFRDLMTIDRDHWLERLRRSRVLRSRPVRH